MGVGVRVPSRSASNLPQYGNFSSSSRTSPAADGQGPRRLPAHSSAPRQWRSSLGRKVPHLIRQRNAQRHRFAALSGKHLWVGARKNGFPDPIIHTYEPELGPDGKLQAKPNTMRQMTDAEIEAL